MCFITITDTPDIPFHVWCVLMSNPQKSESYVGETLTMEGCDLSMSNSPMSGKSSMDKTISYTLVTDGCGSFFPYKSLDNLDIGSLSKRDVRGGKENIPRYTA